MNIHHAGTISHQASIASQRFYSYSDYRHGFVVTSQETEQVKRKVARKSCNKRYTIMSDFSLTEKPLSTYALGLFLFLEMMKPIKPRFSVKSLLKANPLETRDLIETAITELLKANAIKETLSHDAPNA